MRNNLAHGFTSVGRIDEAIELSKHAIADAERLLSPDHPYALMARHNLASAYQAKGRLDDSIEIYEKNLGEFERVVGPDNRP